MILELKYEKTALEGLEQIINPDCNYCDIFENKNDEYVKNVKSYLLIGTNMSVDKKISMVALLKNKNIENKITIHP
mgnify:CR=1 FL=1